MHTANYTTSSQISDQINGDDLVGKLLFDRYEFTKNLNKNSSAKANLPKAEYIFNRDHEAIITFNGLDFVVRDNQVIGIKGLSLSNEVLAQITKKLVFLDRVQYYYSEKSNLTYLNPNMDIQDVKYLDKQFFSALKILNATVRDISAFTKKQNPSLTVEMNISKMRQPNIDKSVEKQSFQSLVQLAR
ncbi:hypothetical protein DU508_15845 [Pedobacter chinensis]|uniref:Uncharacterized protein n=1 Tax=Pedobacter chinensis TaxID=2282421 RepID=A0A369PSW4_9SPHI|nr:hypothetical protein DU508_15845 [Pedobacter chinensis]